MNAGETAADDNHVGGTTQMLFRGFELEKEMVAGHGASNQRGVSSGYESHSDLSVSGDVQNVIKSA